MQRIVLIVFVLVFVAACAPQQAQEENPAAEGFDVANSDPAAIDLADSIMLAMGGRKNWDATRFISWTFFGSRKLVWDKHSGWVRIDNPRDTSTIIVNEKTLEGKVSVKGQELAPGDSLQKMLAKGKSIWINDSYWLVMPFKLKDSGVTLTLAGTDTLKGNTYRILQLTFANVGDTPQNKYKLYVDNTDKLIKHWAYFKNAASDTANFIRPWDNYKKYGTILLSSDRSDKGGPSNVTVTDSMPDSIFTKF